MADLDLDTLRKLLADERRLADEMAEALRRTRFGAMQGLIGAFPATEADIDHALARHASARGGR